MKYIGKDHISCIVEPCRPYYNFSMQSEPESNNEQYSHDISLGDARITIQADIPENACLEVSLRLNDKETTKSKPVVFHGSKYRKPKLNLLRKLFPAKSQSGEKISKFAWILLAAALIIYLVTRFVSLPDYPIYFFTDEAVQTVSARELIQNDFRSPEGELLPTYFYNGFQYNLSFSVYAQIIPYLIFGENIWVTRGVSVLVSLLAVFSVGMILMRILNRPAAWGAVLFLSITPAWFLHSRTAFETVMGTSFYALFLFLYLCYRTESPKMILAAVPAAACAFYSYSPMQGVVGISAVLLFLTDIKYHLKNWKWVLYGLGLALITALPYIRFMWGHASASIDHLRQLNSYWIQQIPLSEKLATFFGEYLHGLNPMYWYLPNDTDLNRHLMKDYGHVLWWTFPIFLMGLWYSLRRIRQAPYRTLLIALLCAPVGASMVAIGITRTLVMTVPLALITGLGLSAIIEWISDHVRFKRAWLLMPVFLVLAGVNAWFPYDALTNGPLWFTDYELGGMQYGGEALFTELHDWIDEHPDDHVVVSPSWANGTDTIAMYYFDNGLPFDMGSIQSYIDHKLELDRSTMFVMIPEEYEKVLLSSKFNAIQIEQRLFYPDGTPGFFFVRLSYADNADEIFAAEERARKELITEPLTIQGHPGQVSYSYLDMGNIDHVFDQDEETLARTFEANPFVVKIELNEALSITGARVKVGGTPTKIVMLVESADGSKQYEIEVDEERNPRWVQISLPEALSTNSVRFEIWSVRDSEPAHVHLWEIELVEQ